MRTALSFASSLGVIVCCLLLATLTAFLIETGLLFFTGYKIPSTDYITGFLTATWFWPLDKRVKEAFARAPA